MYVFTILLLLNMLIWAIHVFNLIEYTFLWNTLLEEILWLNIYEALTIIRRWNWLKPF